MNKKETIRLAACYAGKTFKDEQEAVEGFLCAISALLGKQEDVVIPDFGKFSRLDIMRLTAFRRQVSECLPPNRTYMFPCIRLSITNLALFPPTLNLCVAFLTDD